MKTYFADLYGPAELKDFEKFPPRQKPASFNLDAVLAQAQAPHG